jgi:uncharacterized protein (UPF0261 family)
MSAAYVIGTFDTKAAELGYLVEQLQGCGVSTTTIDVSLRNVSSPANVSAREVASRHPDGASAVFDSERPSAIEAMGEALRLFLAEAEPADAYVAVCGSTGASIVSPALRALPFGTPRLMVSSIVSGDVSEHVGASDLTLMHSVADLAGLNSMTRVVLANAAHAVVGMVKWHREEPPDRRAVVGMTSLGVTSACSEMVRSALSEHYECISFTATPAGGLGARDLIERQRLGLFIDICMSDIAKGVISGSDSGRQESEQRLGSIATTGTPYIACLGGLDFTVWRGGLPSDYSDRTRLDHNAAITLVRTSADEGRRVGLDLGDRLNSMPGPVHVLIPDGGLSALDMPGRPFRDPDANRELLAALESRFEITTNHRLEHAPSAINDPLFAEFVGERAMQLVRT